MAFTGVLHSRQVEDLSGVSVSGAKIYFYLTGTTTKVTVYSDAALTTPTTNPVIADAAGYFTAYTSNLSAVDVVIKSADDATTYDEYSIGGTGGDTDPENAEVQDLDVAGTMEVGSPTTGDYSGTDGEVNAEAYFQNGVAVADMDDIANQVEHVSLYTSLKAYTPTTGDVVFCTGRASVADGGEGMFRWVTGDQSANVTADTEEGIWVPPDSDDTGASGCWKRYFDGTVKPEWYGAAGDGVTDDTDAVAAAVASGYDVEFSDSYLVGAGSIVSTTTTQSLYGNRKSTENATGTKAEIVFTATTGTIIEFQEAFCQIHHLSFSGPSKTTSATAVKAARQSNTDDMEFTVHTVYFETCQIALDVTGRGLNVSDVEAASVGTVIKRSWPTSGTEGTGFQALPWGWRKDQLSRIRPHSSTILLDNSHDANRDDYQVVMTDVYMDLGSGTVFRGQCKNSIFGNIKSHHAVASPFDFTDTIADTSFTNINISGTPSDSSTTPGNGIRFGDDVDRCTFSGINLSYLDSFGILIEGDMLYSTLSGFTINNIGTDGTGTNACLRVVGAITDCAISGGVMESGSGNYHISVDGTVSDSRIVGISYDHANEDLMAGSWTDGGGNIIEDKNTRNVDSYVSGVYRFSVADDAVHSLTPPKNGGMFTVSCMTGPYGPASALVFYDLGGSVNIDLNTGWAGTTSDNVTVSNSTVAGTTGTDAFLNIGTDGTDLQFENRVGNTAVYEVRFL